jgi:hypothetical protein
MIVQGAMNGGGRDSEDFCDVDYGRFFGHRFVK